MPVRVKLAGYTCRCSVFGIDNFGIFMHIGKTAEASVGKRGIDIRFAVLRIAVRLRFLYTLKSIVLLAAGKGAVIRRLSI